MERIEPDALTKTTHVNLLLDFYEELLTEKQRIILNFYYRDDFSLGEIAAEFGISRQAVYDNIKRAEQALAAYEQKLRLLARYEQTLRLTEQLKHKIDTLGLQAEQRSELQQLIEQLRTNDIMVGMEAIKDGSI
ncbi:YlxM family DNA-binding protein [Paenibacillus camelliae]|uniref:YlxM family DNA-binding protein n=1 Tax=Paenibacillus camelliae TaxID=512410 RepID=UPI00203D68AE|nr:YlxM family DNA-binding protein [Paenibacillus camelliae]MCM3632066.1 YlxM family DNA-binding protein [Paenibacillus camelliae]